MRRLSTRIGCYQTKHSSYVFLFPASESLLSIDLVSGGGQLSDMKSPSNCNCLKININKMDLRTSNPSFPPDAPPLFPCKPRRAANSFFTCLPSLLCFFAVCIQTKLLKASHSNSQDVWASEISWLHLRPAIWLSENAEKSRRARSMSAKKWFAT